ncbi:MAG: carboxypeptidase regulatory-like domain-containing protein [Candidatus Acidiferrales bacterium]|jgi:virginiamycin B lyase
MRLRYLVALVILCSSPVRASTITGSVKGPDHRVFPGAFVEAQNTKTRITVAVLSDTQGRYRIGNLPAGPYRLFIRAVGYRTDPRASVNLTADQNASFDFALQNSVVRWSDISVYQGKQLFPAGPGKDLLFKNCDICHGFQTRMASVTRDADGWRDRVNYMRTVMGYGLARFTDQDASQVAYYLTSLFGPESVLPKSPADMPGYLDTVRPFGGDAWDIVYVEYDMPGPSRMPFSAAPDKNGYLWIPNYGAANKITRLDPNTGEMQDFSVPNSGPAAIHSAVPGPDGSVWLTESAVNKIARWDPDTQQITEYQDKGSKHTVRVDSSGIVWATGSPFTRFDPETKKFTRFEEVAQSYDVKPDKNGDVWFTSLYGHKIGRVDGRTLKVRQWAPPTPGSGPRRLEIAPDGIIWFDEFNAGKMARFDPKTETFQEFPLPGPDPTPYALGFDADGYLWYNSHHLDVLGRFDTKTGQVTEYPFPHSELFMREFFRDSQGRMWYGSNPNNTVGYFYLANKNVPAASK